MENKTITIERSLARATYNAGNKDVKKALETLIGKSALVGTPPGIWCLNDKNELLAPADWRECHSPVGVVVVTEETSFVVGLHASVSLQWGAMDKAKSPLVTDRKSYDSKAATDAMFAAYGGAFYEDNDGKIWNVKGAPAAEWVRRYSVGHIGVGSWDLPTVAQLLLMHKHRDEINDCIKAIGGYKLTPGRCYSSIAHSNDSRLAFSVYMSDGNVHGGYKCNRHSVRAVSAFYPSLEV